MCNGKFALHILKGEDWARNVSDQKKLERIPPDNCSYARKSFPAVGTLTVVAGNLLLKNDFDQCSVTLLAKPIKKC